MKILNAFFTIVFWLLLSFSGWCQMEYNLLKDASELKVTGTSTIHDWEMVASEFDCVVRPHSQNSHQIKKIYFECTSNSIRSNHALMNKKTYEALKSNAHPKIEFRSNELPFTILPNSTFNGSITGTMVIAGKEKQMKLPFQSIIEKNGMVSLNGKVDINMNEFNITPPKAMMGTIKTGEVVTIHYQFKFSNDQRTSDNNINN